MSQPLVSIVVVTFRSANFISRCLQPVAREADFHTIVWENASGDETPEIVRAEYPEVELHVSDENLGFARANNRAFEYAVGEYVLLLNPDAFLPSPGEVRAMADWLDSRPQYAACGPQLLHEDGRHQVGDAGWRISLGSVTFHSLMLHCIFSGLPALYLSNRSLLRRDHVDVDWVCGACMMVRRHVIKVLGGFDNAVFMYGEDIEWGTRMKDAGWRVAYLPQIKVTHLQGATQKAQGREFESTKWIDDIYNRYQPGAPRLAKFAMRISLASGYWARAAAKLALGWITGNEARMESGRISATYARHAWRCGPLGKG